MRFSLQLFDSKVARRIFTSFFIASLLPVGLVAVLVVMQVRDAVEQQAQWNLRDAGRNSGQHLLDRLLAAEFILPYLGAPWLDDPPVQFDAAAMLRDGGVQPLFGSFDVASSVGTDAVSAKRTRLLVTETGEVLLARRTSDGVIVGRLAPGYLWGLGDPPFGVDLCVFERATARQLHCSAPLERSMAAQVRRVVAASAQGDVDWSDQGIERLSNHWELFVPARFDAEPWSVFVSQPKSVALGPLAAFNRAFPQALAAGLILILLISIAQIRRILKPLNYLVRGTRRIAERNFSTRFRLRSDDEFGALGAAMNDMAEALGSQFDTLTALSEIDRLILASSDTEQVFDAVLERISRVVPDCEIAMLLIEPGEPERGRLYRCREASGGREDLQRVSVSKQLNAWLCQHPDGYIHEVKGLSARLPEYGSSHRTGRVFVQPVAQDDNLQGALFASFEETATIAVNSLQSLKEFATRCAVAISAAEREQRLLHRAHFDALTGLPNRELCYDRLRQALAVARREEHKLAVLFIDLDGFKHVNDSLGHSCGDQLLRETALRLSAALRDTDTVARLGGDEYVVILPHVQGKLEVEVIVSNIMDALKWPFSIDQQMAFVSASIGVTLFPDDAQSVDGLLRKADTAMYKAKDGGRSRHVFFAKEMDETTHERLALQTDLRGALTQGELFLVYQPQIDLAQGRVVCAEALLRWRHPKRGMVPLELFLPVLEETGLVETIGSWVLQTALAEFARWKQAGLGIDRVAVNAATRQLFDADMVDLVDECLHLTELPGSSLEIELTEGTLVTDFARSNEVLRALTERGVRIAIDDFGTGYSSLGYLKDLTFDIVKVDRAFVAGLPDAKSLAIVKAVLGMAHSLGKRVVAEGIESEVQRELLAGLGCDIGQGFLLGRPLPGREFSSWLGSAEATSLLEQTFAFNA